MNAQEIFDKLKAEFGEAVLELKTGVPDPYIFVSAARLGDLGRFLKTSPGLAFDFLESISGVDTTEELHCVYHLFSYTHRHAIVLKVRVPYDKAELPSLSGVWHAANWHEREQYDLFGFVFTGHPDLRRLLLPEDWVGFPLRKTYEYPDEYHGIDHHRADPKEQFKALDELSKKAAEKAKAQQAAAKPADNA